MRRLRRFVFRLAWCLTAGCCPECGGSRSEPQTEIGRLCDHWFHTPVFREPVSAYEACFASPLNWYDLSPGTGEDLPGYPINILTLPSTKAIPMFPSDRKGDAAMLRFQAM